MKLHLGLPLEQLLLQSGLPRAFPSCEEFIGRGLVAASRHPFTIRLGLESLPCKVRIMRWSL